MSDHFFLAGRIIMHTVIKGPSEQKTKLVFLHPKSHKNLSLRNFKCAARIITPGEHLHKKAGVRAGNFENDPYKIIRGT